MPAGPINYSSTGFMEAILDHLLHQVFGFLQGDTNLHFASLVSIASGALLVISYFFGATRQGYVRWLIFGFGLCSAALLVLLLAFPAQIEVKHHYQARVLQVAALPFLAICMLSFKRGWLRLHRQWFSQVGAILTIVVAYQFAWHVYATYQWNGYLAFYRNVMTTESGPIPFEGPALNARKSSHQAIEPMNRGWTHPIMSILVAPSDMSRMVGTRGQTWPLDPTDHSSFPDLERYGVSYVHYLSHFRRATNVTEH